MKRILLFLPTLYLICTFISCNKGIDTTYISDNFEGKNKVNVNDIEFLKLYKSGDSTLLMAYFPDSNKENELDGYYKYYYPDSTLEVEFRRKGGKQSGIRKNYYSNGEIKQIEDSYENGLLYGTKKTFDKQGTLLEDISYYEDRKVGHGFLYYENGKIRLYYCNTMEGEVGYIHRYDSTGKPISSEGHINTQMVVYNKAIKDSIVISVLYADPPLYTTNVYMEMEKESKLIDGRILVKGGMLTLPIDKELTNNRVFITVEMLDSLNNIIKEEKDTLSILKKLIISH